MPLAGETALACSPCLVSREKMAGRALALPPMASAEWLL